MTLPKPLEWPDGEYTAEDMHAYAAAEVARAVAAERERCARLCEAELPSDQFAPVSQQTAGQHQIAAYLASAIREPNVKVSRSPG